MITAQQTPDIPDVPEFIDDKLGQTIRIGDRIAYATSVSSSAILNIAEVLGFQYSKQSYYGPRLKIKVQKEGAERSSLIEVSGNHYVKVPAKNGN